MEEKKENPIEINSFYVIPKLQTNHFDLNKKRKLPAEQLGLPLPKHKHCSENFSSEYVLSYGGQPETQLMNVHLLKGNTNGMCFEQASESESAKDSNSFNEDSDSATSAFVGAKIEPDQAMNCAYDSSSTQSFRYGGAIFESCRTESSTAMELSSTKPEVKLVSREIALPHHDERLHSIHNLEEEHMLELGNQEAYCCEEYGNDNIEQCTDRELEDLLYSNGLNPSMYVLSSGRWNVNQEAQSGARNPTIDQEFEQYFSMLML